jgi:hypothetical protein
MLKELQEIKNFFSINDRIGCFIEWSRIGNNSRALVSLVELDSVNKCFRKIQTFNLTDSSKESIFSDESNPPKIRLIWRSNRLTNVLSFELFEEGVDIANAVQYAFENFLAQQYFNGCFYYFKLIYERSPFRVSLIYINLINIFCRQQLKSLIWLLLN